MKCGKLTINVFQDDDGAYLRAYINGERAAAMNLAEAFVRDDAVLVVENVIVKDEYQRCGIGTKLYERAMQLACADGIQLASDEIRSDQSEGFWKKQLSKRRAKCIRGTGWRLPEGRWACSRYVMREACPHKIDLSGLKRWRTSR